VRTWGEDAIRLARQRVQRATRHTSTWVGVPILALTLIHRLAHARPVRILVLELVVLVLTSAVLWVDRERSKRTGSVVICTAFLIIDTCALLQFGPLMGTGAMYLGWVVFMIFFFDRLLLTLLVLIGELLLVGFAIDRGILHVPWQWLADGMAGWLRVTATMGMLSTLVGMAFRSVLHTLERAVEQEAKARERELAAQQAREESLNALAASQRLELVGRLAGGVAHDFNNILTVLLSGLQTLRNNSEEALRAEAISDMERAVAGASATTRQLLSFVRQGSAPSELAVPSTSIALLARSLKRILPETVELECVAETDASVNISSGELEQALLNFCLNARDAMPQGGKLTLRVRTHRAPSAEGWVAIDVQDTGIGMDPSIGARAFEPFFSTRNASGGTGLGLTMARRSIEAAGGRVEIESKLGRGTLVTLLLPAVSQTASPNATAPLPELQQAPTGIQVLFLEDDNEVRRAVTRILRQAGYEVRSAATVSEAIDALDSLQRCDLLITDAMLPDGDPTRLIQRYREINATRPVLVYSGYMGGHSVITGVERGEYTFLQKPVAPALLLETVKRLLDVTESGVHPCGAAGASSRIG
jgi:signal transduction histidine kinase/CheY-like chemotaxis protein